MEKTYKFLGIGSTVFKVLAYLALLMGTISCLVILIGGGTPDAPRATGLIGLLLGGIYFFLFYTASEVICLLLDIKGIKRPGKCSAPISSGPQA